MKLTQKFGRKKFLPKKVVKLGSGTEVILLVCTHFPKKNVDSTNVTLICDIWQR